MKKSPRSYGILLKDLDKYHYTVGEIYEGNYASVLRKGRSKKAVYVFDSLCDMIMQLGQVKIGVAPNYKLTRT